MFGKNHAIASRSHKLSIKQVACRRFHDKAVPAVPHVLFLASSHSHHHDHFPAHRFKFGMLPDIFVRGCAAVFALQNSTFDFGTRVAFGQFSCICQKQPLMNTIVRYFGNTTSGCPGYRLSFLRNRRPFEKENCVPSFQWMCLCLGYAT